MIQSDSDHGSSEEPPPLLDSDDDHDDLMNQSDSEESLPPPNPKVIKPEDPKDGPRHLPNFLEQLKLELPSTKKRLLLLQASDGEDATSDPDKMADIIKDFWQEVWNDRQGKPTSNVLNNYFNNYDKVINTLTKPVIPSPQVVRDIILSTNNSCAGPDGLPFIIYRNLIDISTDVIHAMLSDLGKGLPPPDDFNYARLFIIPKSSSILISKTRPISVTNADNRIIAKCVSFAITPCLQTFLDEAQQGFTKDRRGSTHVHDIHNLFHRAIDAHTQQIILFMDTKKAFDSIDHAFIHKILAHIGMPVWVCTIVHALMANVRVFPVLSETVNIHISITRGVKQGCPLSPLLFIICYDILIYKIRIYSRDDDTINIHIFAFADDIALSANDIDDLTAIMPIIDLFSSMSGLGLNEDKTRFISSIPFTDSDKFAILNCDWALEPEECLVSSHPYLGIIMGPDITTVDIYKPALDKYNDRLILFKPFLSTWQIS